MAASNKRRGLGRRVIWIAALILLLVGGAVAANVIAEKFKVDPNKDLLTFVVKKKTLQDTVVERGTLESQETCLLYTSPSPRDGLLSRMPSSA